MTARTTVRLPEALLLQAKRKAAAEGRTLTSLIEQGVRLVVSRRADKTVKHNDPPVSKAKGGLREGFEWDQLSSQIQQMDDVEYVERLKRGFE